VAAAWAVVAPLAIGPAIFGDGGVFQAAAIDGAEGDGDTGAHAAESHGPSPSGIPSWIQLSDLIH
jgi:hypothetical protein